MTNSISSNTGTNKLLSHSKSFLLSYYYDNIISSQHIEIKERVQALIYQRSEDVLVQLKVSEVRVDDIFTDCPHIVCAEKVGTEWRPLEKIINDKTK